MRASLLSLRVSLLSVCVCVCSLHTCDAGNQLLAPATVVTSLSTDDLDSIVAALQQAGSSGSSSGSGSSAHSLDLHDAYHAAQGLHAHGKPIPQALCHVTTAINTSDVTAIFYALSLAAMIDGCKVAALTELKVTVAGSLARVAAAESTDAVEPSILHHTVAAARVLGITVEDEALQTILRKMASDGMVGSERPPRLARILAAVPAVAASPASSHASHASSTPAFDYGVFVQLAEDVLRQTIADNSPVNSGAGSKAIFHSTADLVMGLSGLVAAAAQSGAALNVTGGHVWALSQTLLAWRHSQDVGVQGHLLAALPALCAHHHATAANTHGPSTLVAPVYVTLLSPSITLGEQDTVRFSAQTVLGHPVAGLDVAAVWIDTLETSGDAKDDNDDGDDAQEVSEQEAADGSFTLEDQGGRGEYALKVPDKHSVRGLHSLGIRVTETAQYFGKTSMVDLSMAVAAYVKEASFLVKKGKRTDLSASVAYPQTAQTQLNLNEKAKMTMNFKLLADGKGRKSIIAHQVLLQFLHQETQQELFFVGKVDGADGYKVTVDMAEAAEDSFEHTEGIYQLNLMVGDTTLKSPIHWHVATANVTFADTSHADWAPDLWASTLEDVEQPVKVIAKNDHALPIVFAFITMFVPMTVLLTLWSKVSAPKRAD